MTIRDIEGRSPQYDQYQRMRRHFPSSMQGDTIDRAVERLTLSGHALADVPSWRLIRILDFSTTTTSERGAIRAELRRRQEHCVSEEDAADLKLLIEARVVAL